MLDVGWQMSDVIINLTSAILHLKYHLIFVPILTTLQVVPLFMDLALGETEI